MAVYIIGTALSVLFSYISTNIHKSKQLKYQSKNFISKFFAFMSFIPLTAIMAIRYNVGTDYRSYELIFIRGEYGKEQGYALINSLLRKVTSNPQIIFAVSSAIICAGYFWVIYKESANPAYSILLFVAGKDYFCAMNGIRQYIATAIAILAIPFIKKREWIKVSIIFLIAFSFHNSVIIILIMLLLNAVDIKPLTGGAIIIATLLSSNIVVRLILPILERTGIYFQYFSSAKNAGGELNKHYLLIFLSFYILLSYEYDKVKKIPELKLMYSSILLSLLIMSLSSVMPTNIHRLTWHLNAFIVIYTPLAIKSINDKKIAAAARYVVPIAYAIVTTSVILKGEQGVLPYRTFI